jgi:hypothetical protein
MQTTKFKQSSMSYLLSAVLFFSFSICMVQAQSGAVILDIDFTKGPGVLPSTTKVIGGVWRNGWQVTSNGQRIVLDPGYGIRNGIMEVTFTRWDTSGSPTAYIEPPIPKPSNVIGFFEDAGIGKAGETNGDFFILRIGSSERYENKQAFIGTRMKSADGGSSIWNLNFGKWTDLTSDDKTPMTVKLMWKDGKPSFTDVKGNVLEAKDVQGYLDNLRYLVLGGTISLNNGSGVGFRFLRAKLIDLDKKEGSVQPIALKKKHVIFDVDLTKGDSELPPQAVVVGGKWDTGWEVTADNQRLVFDPGYQIRNGVLEVSFTRKDVKPNGPKTDAIGIFEDPSLDHSDVHGDTFLLRIGETEIQQGSQANIKAFCKERIPEHWGMVWEERFGKISDWNLDGKTPMKVKFEWKNGVGRFTDIKGNVLTCPNNCTGKLDNLRYVSLGGDRYNNGASLLGMKFLSIKLVDLDVTDDGGNITSTVK